jgi:flavin-dependent dehydrogenase
MQTKKADVIVVGAGPAGSVAGAILARKGLDVLTLEGGVFPRFQIGESLLPRCMDILAEAGLLDIVKERRFMPKPAALFLQNDKTERFCFAEMFPGQAPQALQVPRADFDQCLSTQARAYGARVLFQQRVDGVEFAPDGSGVKAMVTDTETGAKYTAEAKFLIDCSGYGRVLPRLLNLESPPALAPRMALFAHFEGDVRPEGDAAGDIWVCIHPEGPWTWIIPFSNGRTSIGVVAEKATFEKAGKTDHEAFHALLKSDPNIQKRLSKATPVMKTTRLEGWTASVSKFHAPGWAVTGNASEFLDPIFSSGVTLALESSSRAANLCARQLAGEKIDWTAEYEPTMRKAVGVFRTFVQTWYEGSLQRLFMNDQKPEKFKRAITSVLGGYVLDEQNPFVRDAEGTLRSLQKFI